MQYAPTACNLQPIAYSLMKTALLDYHLPAERIAKKPTRVRRACRLLRLDRGTGAVSHHRFADLPSLLTAGDLLVANNSAVIPARLIGTRPPGGGEAEILLLEKRAPRVWQAMVRPGRRMRPGAVVEFGPKSSYSAESSGSSLVSVSASAGVWTSTSAKIADTTTEMAAPATGGACRWTRTA